MSLSSHCVSEDALAAIEAGKAKPKTKVPPSRRNIAVRDEAAAPEPR
jgi:hypothetical protein